MRTLGVGLMVGACVGCVGTHRGSVRHTVDLARGEVCPTASEARGTSQARNDPDLISIDSGPTFELEPPVCVYSVAYVERSCGKNRDLRHRVEESDDFRGVTCPPIDDASLARENFLDPPCDRFELLAAPRLERRVWCTYETTRRGDPPAIPMTFVK